MRCKGLGWFHARQNTGKSVYGERFFAALAVKRPQSDLSGWAGIGGCGRERGLYRLYAPSTGCFARDDESAVTGGPRRTSHKYSSVNPSEKPAFMKSG
jgi:hypothetical protein